MCCWTTCSSLAASYPIADTCQTPSPPIITGSAKAICRNESVLLSATGCNGTIIWSNGATGDSIRVNPQQTTKYTAVCRAQQGCVSCFANVWQITVNTPKAPTLTASANLVCPGDLVSLTAVSCQGLVRWVNSNGDQLATGSVWQTRLQETTSFRATCEQNNCVSNPSLALVVQTALPVTPAISADVQEICPGQTVTLRAHGCLGTIVWSDGGSGITRTLHPEQSTQYRAICQIGQCASDSSASVAITVRPISQTLNLATTLTNSCPFQTVDLSKAIITASGLHYVFKTGPSLAAPAVLSPSAVLAGTYYILGQTADGCYTNPVAITVTITPCINGIAPCVSSPPVVAIQLDSLNWNKGVVLLEAQLGGTATQPGWQSSGGGLFTSNNQYARYLLSETDRQQGAVIFTVSVPDPDGTGPCVGATSSQTITGPSREIVGLGKKVNDPVWVTEAGKQLVELSYQLTVANLGQHALTNLLVSDDLDAAFTSAGAIIHSVRTQADTGLVLNPAYTGRGADTTLVTNGRLPVGGVSHLGLIIRLDVSQASTLTFSNEAVVQATDANGMICTDRSTNGSEVDPDQNGNPADNSEPTPVTLHSLRPEETTTVFIPEGFSPNGDGINDRFVIQYVPTGVTVQLDVYNRWGQLVYQNTNYKNDWDGTPNQGIKLTDTRQGLPDGTYYYQVRLSDGREFVRFLTLAR